MPEAVESAGDGKTAALLRVATYLSRPQKFMAVAEARSEMRRTLKMAEQGSVVLTTHGEPEAAVVPFETLEDMRRALLHLLVAEMEQSYARLQSATRRDETAPETSEEELESLTGEALREARRSPGKTRKRPAR